MSSSGTGENPFHIYILTTAIFILASCCCCVSQRRLCLRRLRMWQWDVEDPNQASTLRARYPRDEDPRQIAAKEDAEKAKKEYILGKLQDYTKVCILSI